MQLPWALLLLLCAPGSLSLRGPRNVTGTVGGSLSVSCQYREEYKGFAKYWCRQPCLPLFSETVETSPSGGEVRRGRVSITDHPGNLTFTVTLENLTASDAGKYRCGISTILVEDGLSGFLPDPLFQVQVFVSAEGFIHAPLRAQPQETGCELSGERGPWGSAGDAPPLRDRPETRLFPSGPSVSEPGGSCSELAADPGRMLQAPVWESAASSSDIRSRTPGPPSHDPGSLLSSIHFLLLIFLKVPLFLSMLSAVLWVNRPQRAICGRTQSDYDNPS